MTRHELHEILKTPLYGRKMLEWEHVSKRFYEISNDLALKQLMQIREGAPRCHDDPVILKCESNQENYYFGVDLEDCDNIALKDLIKLYNNASWYVYTWAD